MKCKKHPGYKAIRQPTADCQPCRDMYADAQDVKKPAAPKPKTAAEMIAARKKQATPDPSPAAVAQLKELIAYNDGMNAVNTRIGIQDAINMLRTHGWPGNSRTALDTFCIRVLGRRSYGTP